MNEFKEVREKEGLTITEVAEQCGVSERTVYRWDNGETEPKKAFIELIKSNSVNGNGVKYETNNEGKFKFIDLFAGIGGFRKAFEPLGGECIFTCEWDKFCRQTYVENYDCNDHPIEGDVNDVEVDKIGPHNLLVAGFPCQPFSLAGVSKKNSLGHKHGFKDETQGTLFFNIKEILDYWRPEAFLLENVKNLKSHDKGKTFEIIMEKLEDELEYHVEHKVIDAKGFVPQHRERVFIAGFKKDTGFRFKNLDIPDPDSGPLLKTILHPEDGSEEPEPPYTVGPKAKVNEKYTLSDKLWTYLQEYKEKHRRRGNGFGYGLVGPEDTARTMSARYHKDGSEILIKQEDENPRRLTPRECARLMGFDQPGKEKFKIPVSDTQSYQQFGNSVAVPVVEMIAKAMKPHICGQKEEQDPRQLKISIK
ncbi:DNA (cytosine-5-)-methyltransferase [Fodinibius sp. AD559]|uniref:DNA (cytosine-5-)-methyltransferase n=1 Tax=Fodinibius sp. AD559 TaxID=3424179 RepID=UPI004046FEB5